MPDISISPYFLFRRIKITKQTLNDRARQAIISARRGEEIARQEGFSLLAN